MKQNRFISSSATKLWFKRCSALTLLPTLGALGVLPVACSSENMAKPEEVGSIDEALCGVQPTACTATTPTCNLGIWPGGVINYQWSSGTDASTQNKPIRAAMNDWQTFTHGIIQFKQSSTATPRVQVFADNGGLSDGYSGCSTAPGQVGKAHLGPSNAYHELGHVIGLKHEFQRFDREHYAIMSSKVHKQDPTTGVCLANLIDTVCSDVNNVARCGSATSAGTFGPYDYESTMQYYPTHPDISRWDGSPIVNRPESLSCTCPGLSGLAPPQCTDTSCTNCGTSNTQNSGTVMCPSTDPSSPNDFSQPNGLPTKGDAAAVVELYATTGLWSAFKRTIDDNGELTPFNNSLAPGVTISSIDPTPAVETWEGGTLGLYVWGSDKRYYHKWKVFNGSQFVGWSAWTPFTDGTFTSAPSVVSWGNGRTDLVGRGGDNAIWIKSYVNGAWQSGWHSLGGNALSAPSIVSWGANRLDIFARTTGDHLMVASCASACNGGASGFGSFSTPFGGGTFKGKPAAVSRGSTFIDVFVHGMDDTLWANAYNSGSPYGWYQVRTDKLGWNAAVSADQYSPAADARSTSALDVFVRGQDDQLWVTTYNGSTWNPYFAQGGVLIGAPATVSKLRTTNHIDVVGVMGEETAAPSWQSRPTLTPGVWLKTYN